MPVVNFDALDTTGTVSYSGSVSGNIKCTTLTVTGAADIAGNISASGGYILRKVSTDLTATGTTRADALQLVSEMNNLTTVAASTGVILPVGVIGMTIRVFNNGASAVQVYASASETINGTAGATGISQANAKVTDYVYVKANTWISILFN